MSISIRQLRFSLIWLKSLSPKTPLASLEDAETFKAEFEKAKDPASDSLWSVPWKMGREQSYWEYYLYKYKMGPGRRADKLITKHKAWEGLMPLRLRSLGKLKVVPDPTWLSESPLYVEAYCYPHAVAVIVNLTIREDKGLPVEEVVDRTVNVRSKKWFAADWLTSDKTKSLSLADLATQTLDYVAGKAFGDDKTDWLIDELANPFTIATVIDATGTDPKTKSDEIKESTYGDLNRALDGLCSGSPEWREYGVTANNLLIKKTIVPMPPRTPPPEGHVLRATESGRAVWFPKYFTEHFDGQEKERPVLGSYHRRLTLSTLQVENLITFLQRNQGSFKSGTMTPDLSAKIGWACQILGKLYGARGTYRSYSANEQIETRVSFVNSIRKGMGMKELHRA